MIDKKKCPFCNELNEIDNKFCIYCGKELPKDYGNFDLVSEDDVSNTKEEPNTEIEFIHCPECYALNFKGNVECEKCGYLLNTDITKSFHISNEKRYRRCPKCGNILPPNDNLCNICGYDFIIFDYDSHVSDEIDFFKKINKFHDYDEYLFQFSEFCMENNIDLSCNGLLECPQCSYIFSFISPYFIRNHKCPFCGNEFDFVTTEEVVYCLNCGKPVKEGQTKCKCGYELAEIKCPSCNEYNSYTNNYCTSCGTTLRRSKGILPKSTPRGCNHNDHELFMDTDILKEEIILKKPFQIDNKIYTQTLYTEFLKYGQIINEICSRWLIVSPFNCKSCQNEIDPLTYRCPTCNIPHHDDVYDDRLKELKTTKNDYFETNRDIDELSNLKWTYKLSESDLNDYLNSLAPMIGEIQFKYRERLFKEWWETSAIIHIIRSEWAIYFKNICMNCGNELEPYNLHCPSCGMEKYVPALSMLLNDEYVETGEFPRQYDAFSRDVKEICKDNGGDIRYFDDGIVGCPGCSNYFHYLTPDFIDTHRCPHCGAEFTITAKIYTHESDLSSSPYVDDWDEYGVPYDEWMEMQRF